MKKLLLLILLIPLLLGSGPFSGGPIDGTEMGLFVGDAIIDDLTVSGTVNATGSVWTGFSGDTTGNAATATSLASNPTDCAANTVATAIDATGNLTCGYALNADIQAYDADLDTWSGISPSTDMQAFLGAANDTAALTELGLGTIATQNADNAAITGGTIDGATIGGTTPAAGTFTDLAGNVVVITDSATGNVTAAQMKGQTHRITGAYTLSLPTAAAGYKARFRATTAAVFSLDVVTGTDVINLNGTALTAGNKVTSDGTINNTIECESDVAGKYECNSLIGLAIDGGA